MKEAIRTRYNTSLTILRKILLYRDIEDVWKVKTGVEKTSHHFCYTISADPVSIFPSFNVSIQRSKYL